MLTLLKKPCQSQPISLHNPNDLLAMQNELFGTLLYALRRLEPVHHRRFMVLALTIILDVPNLNDLPLVSLAELMFSLADCQTDARKILNLQNVLVYATQSLEGCYA